MLTLSALDGPAPSSTMAPSACSACSEDVIVGLTAADVLSGCSPCKACGEMVPPSSVAAAAALVREGLDLSPGDEGVTRARRPHAEPRPHGGRALRAHGSTMFHELHHKFCISINLYKTKRSVSCVQYRSNDSNYVLAPHADIAYFQARESLATWLAEASACRPAAMGLARYLSKSNGELRHPGRARSTSEYSSPGAFGIGVAVRSSRAAAGTWATALAVAVAQAVRLVDDEEVDADGRRGEERVAVVMQRLVRHDEDGVLEGLPELRRRWHRGQRAELAPATSAPATSTCSVVRASAPSQCMNSVLQFFTWWAGTTIKTRETRRYEIRASTVATACSVLPSPGSSARMAPPLQKFPTIHRTPTRWYGYILRSRSARTRAHSITPSAPMSSRLRSCLPRAAAAMTVEASQAAGVSFHRLRMTSPGVPGSFSAAAQRGELLASPLIERLPTAASTPAPPPRRAGGGVATPAGCSMHPAEAAGAASGGPGGFRAIDPSPGSLSLD